MAVIVNPPQVAQVKPTGITYIAFERQNMQIHIKNRHATVGVNFENPSEILAKLFALIPVKIPSPKNI